MAHKHWVFFLMPPLDPHDLFILNVQWGGGGAGISNRSATSSGYWSSPTQNEWPLTSSESNGQGFPVWLLTHCQQITGAASTSSFWGLSRPLWAANKKLPLVCCGEAESGRLREEFADNQTLYIVPTNASKPRHIILTHKSVSLLSLLTFPYHSAALCRSVENEPQESFLGSPLKVSYRERS